MLGLLIVMNREAYLAACRVIEVGRDALRCSWLPQGWIVFWAAHSSGLGTLMLQSLASNSDPQGSASCGAA